MRALRLVSTLLILVVATPVLAQSTLQTHDEAARRRQAERYAEEIKRQNLLIQERQRPLSEAAPSHVSNPPPYRDRDDPDRPRGCPANQFMC